MVRAATARSCRRLAPCHCVFKRDKVPIARRESSLCRHDSRPWIWRRRDINVLRVGKCRCVWSVRCPGLRRDRRCRRWCAWRIRAAVPLHFRARLGCCWHATARAALTGCGWCTMCSCLRDTERFLGAPIWFIVSVFLFAASIPRGCNLFWSLGNAQCRSTASKSRLRWLVGLLSSRSGRRRVERWDCRDWSRSRLGFVCRRWMIGARHGGVLPHSIRVWRSDRR